MANAAHNDGRVDGRASNEIRPLSSKQGALFRADGSARMAHGNTIVLAAVYGPGQAKSRRNERPDRATIDVVFKLEKGMSTSKEKEYEQVVRQTFEPIVMVEDFPRAVISVVVQVIEDSGSLLSVAINAVTLALMDAGVPMKSVVTASSCAVQQDGSLVLDPSTAEEDQAAAIVTSASSNAHPGVLTSIASGVLSDEVFFACLEACQRASDSIIAFVRLVQQKKYGQGA
ncbi:TPA: hypothetical protein N0F65_011410 [Lagenidium giganteum]|uniref:Exoribonuclease phosphorolytic domain-containing protein n=1 Tax=Lagenidium giganteum TaxID=4803 RepID=A0AAV2ZE28_9STRA|nr:TPA: hypothetical protein N0F65_011410 [Lagenidium giganteum]